MRKRFFTLLAVLLAVVWGSQAMALQATFFGEDLVGVPYPNSLAAETSFLSNLVGVGTETFESFTLGDTGPLNVNFSGAGTATLTGSGEIQDASTGCCGRFPISGEQWWNISGDFIIEFTEEIAAFGFYGIDIGDFNGQVTVTTANGSEFLYEIPNTINGPSGSTLYWGLIDTENPFTMITFGNTAPGVDFFGFDDMTIGVVEQVNPVPEPATMILMGSGMAGLAAYRRKKKSA